MPTGNNARSLKVKLCAAILASIFVLSAVITGTMAWSDLRQHRTNAASGIHSPAAPQDFEGLIVTNTVINDDGSPLTLLQQQLAFTYRIEFDTTASYPLRIGEAVSNISSGGTFQLKHGEAALIENLPEGTIYTLVETDSLGYTVSSTNHHANIPAGGTVAAFTNTFGYPDQHGAAQLVIRKVVAGAGNLNKPFAIVVILDGASETITLKHGETRTYNLPFGVQYDVREANPVPEGYAVSVDNGFGTGTGGVINTYITNTLYQKPEPTTAPEPTTSEPEPTTTDPGETTTIPGESSTDPGESSTDPGETTTAPIETTTEPPTSTEPPTTTTARSTTTTVPTTLPITSTTRSATSTTRESVSLTATEAKTTLNPETTPATTMTRSTTAAANGGSNGVGGSPKTGDPSNYLPWFCAMICSAIGLRALLFWHPKKRSKA